MTTVTKNLSLVAVMLALLSPVIAAQTGTQSPSEPPAATESERFDIDRYVIEGNTLLGVGEIEIGRAHV